MSSRWSCLRSELESLVVMACNSRKCWGKIVFFQYSQDNIFWQQDQTRQWNYAHWRSTCPWRRYYCSTHWCHGQDHPVLWILHPLDVHNSIVSGEMGCHIFVFVHAGWQGGWIFTFWVFKWKTPYALIVSSKMFSLHKLYIYNHIYICTLNRLIDI